MSENTKTDELHIPQKLGDLEPLERAHEQVATVLAMFREHKATEDEYERGIAYALSVFEPALKEAAKARLLLTPQQMADIQRTTVAALYKRIQRAMKSGREIPGLRRDGRNIRFELAVGEA